jgi:hypothetical protein
MSAAQFAPPGALAPWRGRDRLGGTAARDRPAEPSFEERDREFGAVAGGA